MLDIIKKIIHGNEENEAYDAIDITALEISSAVSTLEKVIDLYNGRLALDRDGLTEEEIIRVVDKRDSLVESSAILLMFDRMGKLK